jgi:hypothetical protein
MREKLGQAIVRLPTNLISKEKAMITICVKKIALACGVMTVIAATMIGTNTFAATSNDVQTTDQGVKIMATEIEQRGKQLRIDIDNTYKDLSDKHALKMQNYVSDVVGKYISVGISIEDAKAILKAAGLKIQGQDDQFISATAKLNSSWIGSSEVYVYITSGTSNNNRVEKIEALITSATL